ncbi:MAG: leucyl aminopeptidase, partial [Acidobacteriota bacterium]|nr:leucyl aminopeptidase [Acidobacteriota bacterium]
EGPAIVHVGCGRLEDLSTAALRRAGGAVARVSGRRGTAVVLLPAELAGALPSGPAGDVPLAPATRRAAQAITEGAVLAGYRFDAHKSDDGSGRLGALVVAGVGIEGEVLEEGVRRGAVVAGAACFARDLVNEPPSLMTPAQLGAAAEAYLAGRSGVTFEAWGEERIREESLGGLLAVARGSAEPPRLIRARYRPADPVEVGGRVPHLVLVGKGITFDSGGLSLKTPEGMTTMKTDMSGAAAVVAAVGACSDLGVRVAVTAIAPITENMPGGRAQKPGDVLTTRSGQTIEVLNTDAEGRLVLADGLSLAVEEDPDAIVDLATLTGAAVVALGRSIAGLFGNDEGLVGQVGRAARRAGEGVWRLPLAEEYHGDIDSEVADMKNVGKAGQAGAVVAALLLERFVDGRPWVHLDIAGPARSDEDGGILTKGATGFGVRTLVELAERFAVESPGTEADAGDSRGGR